MRPVVKLLLRPVTGYLISTSSGMAIPVYGWFEVPAFGRLDAAASQLIAVRQQQQGPAAKGDPPPGARQLLLQLLFPGDGSTRPSTTGVTGPQPTSQQEPIATSLLQALLQRHSPVTGEQVGLQGSAANAQGRSTAGRWMVDGANQPWCWSRDRNPAAHSIEYAAFN